MMMRRAVAAVLAMTLTACATIDHGPMQRVYVASDPPGAEVRLSKCGTIASKEATTPASVWVSRRADRCRVTFHLGGHEPREYALTRRVALDRSLVFTDLCNDTLCDSLGDVAVMITASLALAAVGLSIDAVSGALFEQEPAELFVDFADSEEEMWEDPR